MRIGEFIQTIFRGRAEKAGALVVYDPVGRYRDLVLTMVNTQLTVLDASESFIADRKGNWVQKFGSPEEAQLFAVSQFRRFQEAEAFVRESFGKPRAVLKVLDEKKGGRR